MKNIKRKETTNISALSSKKKLEKETWDNDDYWEVVVSYGGMIANLAKKLTGDRHFRQDLYQQGHLIGREKMPQCEDRRKTTAYLKSSLKWEMLDYAAKHLWGHGGVCSLDAVETELEDRSVLRQEYAIEKAELEALLEKSLTDEERKLLWLKRAGKKTREIAEWFGISPRMVLVRIDKIRKKLLPELAAYGK